VTYLPHQGVHTYSEYTADLHLTCDVVVVGSGPGGAVAAKTLAEAGKDVIVLEEGPPFAPTDFTPDAGQAMQRLMRESGMRTTRGNIFMPTLQAIGLGGGSLVNSAISIRAPEWVFEKWQGRSGTSEITAASLAPYYQRVEDFWGLETTSDAIQGDRNFAFKRGCDALGIACEAIVRNTHGCRGSSECFSGCRNAAKQSTDISFLPAAMRNGARVYSGVRVEQIDASGRRATRVRGHVVSPTWNVNGVSPLTASYEVTVDAKAIVLAAGCMATPVILEKSGLGGRWVGKELQFHPGLAIMAVFPEPIYPWRGAAQGYHSLQYLREGMKLEVLWAPTAVLAARLPGFGHDFKTHLLDYNRMAPFDVLVAADNSYGEVHAKRGGFEPDIKYHFAQADVDLLLRGMAILSDIAWAAGAVEILPGITHMPERLRSKEEAEMLRTKKVLPNEVITASNHAFGSTRMSKHAKDGVVDEWGRVHTLDNVYIADTGVFPGSPAVNPMLTAMALADRTAQSVAARL
jgi:choline dehydrogenase-like flavoprotein